MHQRTYIITAKTTSKSDMGLEIFDNRVRGIVATYGDNKKTRSARVSEIPGMSHDKILATLKATGINSVELSMTEIKSRKWEAHTTHGN